MAPKQSIAPFHHAFPVHSLAKSREFYGDILGLEEGRSSSRWIDYNMFGHQIVCHLIDEKHRSLHYYNSVDKDDVPVPHFGVCLNDADFHKLAKRLVDKKIKFVVEPHLRFKGQPGEQWTMFFLDPSNNALEFKSMVNPENLFARYYVPGDEEKKTNSKL
jgi:extradiol dioxygenase family protein